MRRPEPSELAGRLAPPILGGLALAPLALACGGYAGFALVLAAGAAVANAALRSRATSRVPFLLALPLVVALVADVALAPPGLFASALAGLAGLGVLVAAAWEPARPPERLLKGAVLPALAVAIAWCVAYVLPVGQGQVGVALVLLLLAVAGLAWALPRGSEPGRAPAS